ncbi:MAG TPA: cytochrome c [Kofleriaceae bacterium]|nr:cytochrome c [Kofleriaceae bacterium]
MTRAWLCIALAACDWSLHRMQDQPSCKPFEPSALFRDGACMQTAPVGVVAFDPTPDGAEPPPPAITRALVERGRDRFDRFCAACHGLAADGDAQVTRAMTLRRPPTLVDVVATSLTDDRVLAVIARGYGVMPGYAAMIAPRDRYAILHYVRALQQRAIPLAALPAAQQQEARQWLR